MVEFRKESLEFLAAHSEAEIQEYFDNPLWKYAHYILMERRDILINDILNTDVAVRSAMEPGRKHRSNESLVGGIVEIDFAIQIPGEIADNAAYARSVVNQLESEKGENDG